MGIFGTCVFFPVLVLVVMSFLRSTEVPGTGFSLGAMTISGVLGMLVAYSGLTTPAYALMSKREDGTLLRIKATPNGMQG